MHRSNVWVRCASGNVLNSLTNTDSIGLISLDFIAKCVFSNLRVFRFKFYPEVTLDNFSFPVGGRSAARRAVFWHRWPKMAIFGDSHLRRESTPYFGPISIKLGQIVRITKKMTLNKCGPGWGPNYGETAEYG